VSGAASGGAVAGGVLGPEVAAAVVGVAEVPRLAGLDELTAAHAGHAAAGYATGDGAA
jgi:hypothetical protein